MQYVAHKAQKIGNEFLCAVVFLLRLMPSCSGFPCAPTEAGPLLLNPTDRLDMGNIARGQMLQGDTNTDKHTLFSLSLSLSLSLLSLLQCCANSKVGVVRAQCVGGITLSA